MPRIPIEPRFATTLDHLGSEQEIYHVFGLVEYDPEDGTWTPLRGSTNLQLRHVSPSLKTAVVGVIQRDGSLVGTLVSF